MEDKEKDSRLIVYEGIIGGKKKLFTVSYTYHLAMVDGSAILNRVLIPCNEVQKVTVELVKYPFRNPEIRIAKLDGTRRIFSKKRKVYYAITPEHQFIQSHDISEIKIIEADNLAYSKEDLIYIANDDLIGEYKDNQLVKKCLPES